jgi:hypothetical protein
MALTGYEKSLEQYSKNELVEIAKKYTIYYQTDSGQGSTSNYDRLTKEKLISIIKSDRDYQSAAPPSRKLSRVEMMAVIQEVFDDIDSIPKIGNIYTFEYTAITPRILYDKHPLIFVESYNPPYFIGFNVHWPDYRNYLLGNVTNQVFHRVRKGEEFDYLHDVPYKKILST